MKARASIAAAALAVAALTVGPPAPAQAAPSGGGWVKQSPLPVGEDLHGVDMISPTEGWAAGGTFGGSVDVGAILHTTDGGVSWEVQKDGTLDGTKSLWNVAFVDDQHGFVSGNALLYTEDGGETWGRGVGALGTWYGLDALNASRAWASTGGNVAYTTDGGRLWTPVRTGTPLTENLVSVEFVDAVHGWAGGTFGSIVATDDGGRTWHRQHSGTDHGIFGFSFVSPLEGWAGIGDAVLHTVDGGENWESLALPGGSFLGALHFVDAQHGWAVGIQQRIYATEDGGLTWHRQFGARPSVRTFDPYNKYLLNSVDVVGDTGVTVGGHGVIFTTSDASNRGGHWVERQHGAVTPTFRLTRTDERHLWAANGDGEILWTDDGGEFWHRSGIATAGGSTGDIDMLDNREGWAVANANVFRSFVYHTIDGGRTWNAQGGVLNTGGLAGVAIVDENTVVAVSGVFPLITRTTDGGQTWHLVNHPPAGQWFGSVRFAPGTQTGWTVGEGGVILKTTDGGATWEAQESHVSANLIDSGFVDELHGWIAGGVVLHTDDGGETWVRQPANVNVPVSVDAVDVDTAWVGGVEDMARTTDGGETWEHMVPDWPITSSWFAVEFLDAERGWAAGQDEQSGGPGAIWRRLGDG